MRSQHLRVVRATLQLDAIQEFYREVLGFELVGEFAGHDGFDGVMLAHPDSNWHLEFTCDRGAQAHPPAQDDALVLYYREDAYDCAVARALKNGCRVVRSHNPYWDLHGITIEDPDGHRVVLHRGTWTNV